MGGRESIFLEFNLPNATTWFYFSFLLAVALFFKFSRVLSVRNWDVITLFLLVPGFLLLQQAKPIAPVPQKSTAVALAGLAAGGGTQVAVSPSGALTSLGNLGFVLQADEPGLSASRLVWFAYLWLLCGSAYFFLRCLLDLALVSRPALAPNLSFGGLAWLAGALFVCLIAVAYRPERTQGGRAAPLSEISPGGKPALSASGSTDGKTALPEGQQQNIPVGQAIAQRSFGYWLTARTFAVLCHVAIVLGLIVIGYRHFQDPAAGIAAATFYLMLPYTGLHVGQVNHVWPMTLFVWAVAAYRFPLLAGVLIGTAAVTAYAPALTLPIWMSFYWRRGIGRFLSAFVIMFCVGLGAIGVILMENESLASIIKEVWSLSAWQPWRVPTSEGFWTGVGWAYRIPIFIAYAAFVILTAFWPAPKNLAHVVALSAAVLIGIQFWYADEGGAYVLWYLPLLVLLVFRPNLSERRPPLILADTDWLARSRRGLARPLSRILKSSEPALRAH